MLTDSATDATGFKISSIMSLCFLRAVPSRAHSSLVMSTARSLKDTDFLKDIVVPDCATPHQHPQAAVKDDIPENACMKSSN